MFKVLYDDDDSDDHSEDESDDERNSCNSKAVKNGQDKDVKKIQNKDLKKSQDKDVKKGQDKDVKKGQDKDVKKGQDKDVKKGKDKAGCKGQDKGAQKIDVLFNATSTFLVPTVPSTPLSIPTSTTGDNNKLRYVDIQIQPTEKTHSLNEITPNTKAYAMFGTPSANKNGMSVVTPYLVGCAS
jgi:hypothetical protein